MEALRPKASDANLINRKYLDRILVEMRLLDSVIADTTFELFGKTFASPIMTPAFSHMRNVCEDGLTPLEQYSKATADLNLVNFIGMEGNEMVGRILGLAPNTVRIIKPYADHGMILDQIQFAQDHGALAVGMDIDHVFNPNAGYDVIDGLEMGPVTCEDLSGYISASKLPFVVKGVLSVTDALKSREAGASAIMVSHHHGRVPFGMPPLMALPEIKEAVGGSMKIFVDCSIDDGIDAFKALALGAHAVCVGRAMMEPLAKGGVSGVSEKLLSMQTQLTEMMEFTNIRSLSQMTPDVLRIPAF